VSDGMSSVAQDAARVMPGRYPGAIVTGLDVHLRQITFDCLDSATGEVTRGRIAATPVGVEGWVAQFPGREVHAAMEACTGWLFVARALERAGAVAHLAETVETRALRGRNRRAKTDRQDALWLRELLAEGRLPESWIAPEHLRNWVKQAERDERTRRTASPAMSARNLRGCVVRIRRCGWSGRSSRRPPLFSLGKPASRRRDVRADRGREDELPGGGDVPRLGGEPHQLSRLEASRAV
jgi:hypothetical protein